MVPGAGNTGIIEQNNLNLHLCLIHLDLLEDTTACLEPGFVCASTKTPRERESERESHSSSCRRSAVYPQAVREAHREVSSLGGHVQRGVPVVGAGVNVHVRVLPCRRDRGRSAFTNHTGRPTCLWRGLSQNAPQSNVLRCNSVDANKASWSQTEGWMAVSVAESAGTSMNFQTKELNNVPSS